MDYPFEKYLDGGLKIWDQRKILTILETMLLILLLDPKFLIELDLLQ